MISIKFLCSLAIVATVVLIALTLPHGAVAQRNRPRNCPQICPALYSPVCATLRNGERRQFSNDCALKVAACKKFLNIARTVPGNC